MSRPTDNPTARPTGKPTGRPTGKPTDAHVLAPFDSARARTVEQLCRTELSALADRPDEPRPTEPCWQAVRAAGSEPWLDSGDLDANASVWTSDFAAFTTNNSLLNEEVQKGAYDRLVPRAAAALRREEPGITTADLVLEVGLVLNAVHGRRLGDRFDARVSVELHTDVAGDAEASYQAGRRLYALAPDRFVVKVPNTPEGLIAARRLEGDGVPVNLTLGFSARQNHLIARLARPHFVNVFLGRVSALLQSAPGASQAPFGEAATIRSQRMLRELADAAAIAAEHTRQIAASMRSGTQVVHLAGVDVLTMPVDAARQFRKLGVTDDLDDRTRQDPFESIDLPDPGGRVFEDVDDRIAAASSHLVDTPVELLTGDRIRAVLQDHGLSDLYPQLDDDDRERIRTDGKLPDWSAWASRVADGTASWDGLLTAAGLWSFAADQRELDRHVRELL